MRNHHVATLVVAASLGMACGNPIPGEPEKANHSASSAPSAKPASDERGEVATPPFAVSGDLTGLLLVWFDAEGPHTASTRAEIPEAHRKLVRVDSLGVAPERRLDPDHVYIADLTSPSASGGYPVRKFSREFFDARIEAARPAQAVAQASGSGDVTIYMASWCSACRGAAAYLRSRSVPFVEKDIEKDAQANAEMQQKARAAGKSPRGVPVIDFRGQLILGFDQAALDRLISQPPQPI